MSDRQDTIGTATYSPDDNKLRLYPDSRLDTETYQRVKAAGFAWAPKQELFVTPMWTPSREDLLIELCGEIGDEDISLVDRAEARADRFEDYSDARRSEAESARRAVSSITDGIPMGQPILVGHHSERHARKDAERIENGMRRAVKMWETANYWQSRAAGAIRHAKYKELPAVRARRIKGIEADKRSHERDVATAEKFTAIWSASLAWDPEIRRLTADQAAQIANFDRAASSRCYLLKDYPRDAPASQYEGPMGLWSAITGGVITAEQAREIALRSHAATIRHANRWLAHLNNRLEYERAMLAEAGGLAAERLDIQVGGRVLRRGEWYVVIKANKRLGRLNSVTVSGHWTTTIPIEEINGYEPPSEGFTEKVKAAIKQIPLCNFRTEGCIEMTSAEWKEKSKWGDALAVRSFDASGVYHWRREQGGPPLIYRHRSRYILGSHRPGDGSRVIPVFLTDAKEVKPPAEHTQKPQFARGELAPIREFDPDSRVTRRAQSLGDIRESMFHKYESGNLKAGIKFEYSGEGWSECYQYNTVEDLAKEAQALQEQPRILRLKIVTHTGEYQNMATVYEWERSADAFDAMRGSLKAGVQVVSAPQLFPTPPELATRMVEAAELEPWQTVLEPSAGTGNILRAIEAAGVMGLAVQAVEINRTLAESVVTSAAVKCADFLTCNGDLGKFDRVLMNPPFENGSDIKHIKHALTMLKPGGRLVAICANGPRQNEALKPLASSWEVLPSGTFAGTGVSAVLLSMEAAS